MGVFHKTIIPLALVGLDFLKVVRIDFWSGVVGPGTSFRSLALRAHCRATRSKARLVSKSIVGYEMIIANEARSAELAIYHLISNAPSLNNC